MKRVAILGATGYTALELIKILLRHPEVEITTVTSRQEGNPPISSVHPSLVDQLDLNLENLEVAQVSSRADCVFSCLPHGASASSVVELLNAGCRVIDFSADYRLNDVATYEQWYGVRHPDPDRVSKTAYGLPEWFREDIVDAQLVANPGCYPTSAILALAPLLKAKLIEPEDIIVDSKTGVSGGGRNPKLTFHYPECNESISAYNVGRHRHGPEIEQILGNASVSSPEVIFTPHLVPMDRGILSTCYSRPANPVTEEDVLEVLASTYANEPFVRVVEHLPGTKDVSGTNFCDITARVVKGRVLTISCVDNLIKGASGAAVQNFNVMYGLDETMSLLP